MNAQGGTPPQRSVAGAKLGFSEVNWAPGTSGNDPGYQPFNLSLLCRRFRCIPTATTLLRRTAGRREWSGCSAWVEPARPACVHSTGPAGIYSAGSAGERKPNQIGYNQPGQLWILNQPGIIQPVGNQPGVPGFTIPGTNSPITTPGINNPRDRLQSRQAQGRLREVGREPPPSLAAAGGPRQKNPNQPERSGERSRFGAPGAGVPGAGAAGDSSVRRLGAEPKLST